ncbi:hypothetical protein [Pseudoxanthomonas winnipegensis]|uniref:Fibronectin type-III domain-containing protein n=1 Tax=Pseudoxanthomonas winnipegensis TaxID=2480810 RepID=A0A4Q8L7K9_9GAMM|nr:hypothetical protein [Pseudoxanthomonas winnipegensis]RZZ81116.1 hypothetical protein EA662_19235 [Pseudoxanthomonas winnipegensis]TAA24061.1 hypothetical protein EA661_19580 [Pseudoxanthomonas winnipegensis]TBV71466.1 hypothetical protein EYC46_17695 [Pseudoxanthomonas winnipegensis]
MTAPTVSYEVRHRIIGTDPTDWVLLPLYPAGQDIAIDGMTRGLQYQIQIRAIAGNGKKSAWVDLSKTVAATAREGAAALPTSAVANQASMWSLATTVTYNATSPATGDSSATISVSAGTLVIASKTISYAASSATVTGTAGQSVTYYLYYDDPQLVGGSRVLGLASNIVDSANVDGRIAVAPLTVKFPAAGSSGTGGGSIGGGGGSGGAGNPCPWIYAWVIERKRGAIQAFDVRVGDWLLGPHGWVEVTYSERKRARGVRIVNVRGHGLSCSDSAPILTTAEAFVLSRDLCAGGPTAVDVSGDGVTLIDAVQDLGEIWVQHIICAGAWADRVFYAGDDARYLYPHHNAKAAPGI